MKKETRILLMMISSAAFFSSCAEIAETDIQTDKKISVTASDGELSLTYVPEEASVPSPESETPSVPSVSETSVILFDPTALDRETTVIYLEDILDSDSFITKVTERVFFKTEKTEEFSETAPSALVNKEPEILKWDSSLKYADYSAIHDSTVTLYHTASENPKGKVIAVNAGHGTKGGSSEKTYCHPDKTPKYVTGSTASGQIKSTAISSGMEFNDGTPEAEVTLSIALILREKLLDGGYDVLMLRETDDCQLDNIARTVFANTYADCHISLHFDSSSNDKGAFFIGVPDIKEYKSMEPVASHGEEHDLLGESLIEGLRGESIKIFGGGRMDIDLTQTSFSTIPSVDLEIGDKGTRITDDFKEKAADGIVNGIDIFFSV